jgi:hypothetical protein
MRLPIAIVALGGSFLVASFLPPAPTFAATAQSRSCAARAAKVARADRPAYLAKCKTGSRPAHARTGAGARSASAKAVVQPSGVKPAQRSEACTAEANRRGLHDAQLQAFRDHCIAGVAPVGAIGTPAHPDTPTHDRTDLGPVGPQRH